VNKNARKIQLIPDWVRNYQRPDFKFDLVAGLTVGVMLIPQGMAYAMIAGLPPVYGLYASTLPAIVYAWLGTSRQLSVGPGALTALLTAGGIGLLAQAGTPDYFAMVTLLALTVGLIQFSLGFFRLGFLVNFLSSPVFLGFTSAAAILIGLSQLKHLLGINLGSQQHLQDIAAELLPQLSKVNLLALSVGSAGLIILLVFQKYLSRIPGALVTVILGILMTWFFRLDLQGLKIVGAIPAGLPTPRFTSMSLANFMALFPTAFAIALVSFMESTAVARAIQSRHKHYKLITNRELISLGLANVASGVLQSIPVTGGMSRSTINDQAGARTGMSVIISAILILLTLVFLTPLFYFLPNAILASVILVAVSSLLKIREARKLWTIDRKDFWMMIATFIGTLFLGIGPGIGIGVLLSLAWIIYETSYPHHAELGKVPGTHSFRNLRRFANLETAQGVLIYRFDAPLYFANIDRFGDVLREYRLHRKDSIHHIIIDMEGIHSIDSSALAFFSDLIEETAAEKVRLLLAEVKGPVRDKFYKAGLTEKLGEENFFVTVEDAYDAINGLQNGGNAGIALQTNVGRS
jgi:SulP family sulfate permease